MTAEAFKLMRPSTKYVMLIASCFALFALMLLHAIAGGSARDDSYKKMAEAVGLSVGKWHGDGTW